MELFIPSDNAKLKSLTYGGERSAMVDRGTSNDEATTANGTGPLDAAPATRTETLEERVRRLEDVVAHLQDTRQMEERVLERVASRFGADTSEAIQEPPASSSRRKRPPVAKLAPAGVETNHVQEATRPLATGWFGWLLFVEAYQEARTFVRMYLDRRYRATWLGRIGPPLILVMIVLSYFWIPFTSILPSVIERPLEKAVDLVLAFVLLKILHRESCRYRAAVANFPISNNPS